MNKQREQVFEQWAKEPDSQPVRLRTFESWVEFVEYAESTPSHSAKIADRSSRDSRVDEWAGGSFEESVKRAKGGWAEGRDRFIEIADKMRESISRDIVKTDLAWDVSGDFVDIDAYLQGIPENMVRFEQAEAKRENTIQITLDICQSGKVDPSRITRRGAGIAALIDLLEEAGFSVELDLVYPVSNSYHGGRLIEYRVPIKAIGQPLDCDLSGFALVSPSVQRRLIFSCNENENEKTRRDFNIVFRGGYGSVDPSKTIAGKESQLHLKSNDGMARDDKETERWIREQLVKFGAIKEEAGAF